MAAPCRKANFNSEGFQVGLPVFTIHGNHDDPSGADNLSAVDVLSTCKLLNYFGKMVKPYTSSIRELSDPIMLNSLGWQSTCKVNSTS